MTTQRILSDPDPHSSQRQRPNFKLVMPNISMRPTAPAEPSDPDSSALQQIAAALAMQTAPWNLPPADREPFRFAAGIVIPAIDGNFHVVVALTVPKGRNGVLNRIANEYVGGGFQDFSGNLVWQILRNPANGITTAEMNFENIVASLGEVSSPAALDPGIRIFENDVIQLVVKNVAIAPAAEAIGGLLGGYFYPSAYDEGF